MRQIWIPAGLLISLVSLTQSCGEPKAQNNRHLQSGPMAEFMEWTVTLSFALPSRDSFQLESSTLTDAINGFVWQILPQGENCQDSKIHEAYGAYDSSKIFTIRLSGTCSYLVKVMLGERAGSSLQELPPISYKQHIDPLVQQNCVSCHAEFANFAGVRSQANNILALVESGDMPPTSALDTGSKALFLAWGDGGFVENEQDKRPLSPAEQYLGRIFYRNNYNDLIQDYELRGRSAFELRRSLWIQPAATAWGLRTNQVNTIIGPPTGT